MKEKKDTEKMDDKYLKWFIMLMRYDMQNHDENTKLKLLIYKMLMESMEG